MAKGISRLLPSPGQRVRTTIQPKQNSNQGASVPAPAASAAPSGTPTDTLAQSEPVAQ